MVTSGTRWFAKRTTEGALIAAYKTYWSGGIMRKEQCWSNTEMKWVPTSDVTFQLLVWDKEIEEVEYSAIADKLPVEARLKNPWENY